MDGILRKDSRVFISQLGCQGLIVGDNQSRPIYPCDNVADGKCLSASRNSQEGLLVKPFSDAGNQGVDRFWLVSCGRKI